MLAGERAVKDISSFHVCLADKVVAINGPAKGISTLNLTESKYRKTEVFTLSCIPVQQTSGIAELSTGSRVLAKSLTHILGVDALDMQGRGSSC